MAEAILNGTVVDDGGGLGGLACEVRFRYGTTLAMGSFTSWKGSYYTGMNFQEIVSGLPGNSTIYFQAEARNIIGSITGGQLSFATSSAALPVVSTLPATQITETYATLNGYLAFQGDRPGSFSFEYGASPLYGMQTPWQEPASTGDYFYAVITQLTGGQAYHYRARFKNGGIITYGADMVVFTLSATGGLILIDENLELLLREG